MQTVSSENRRSPEETLSKISFSRSKLMAMVYPCILWLTSRNNTNPTTGKRTTSKSRN